MHVYLHFIRGDSARFLDAIACACMAAFFLYGIWERCMHRDYGAALWCLAIAAGLLAALGVLLGALGFGRRELESPEGVSRGAIE